MRVWACACVCVWAWACMRACARVRVCASVCVSVCACGRAFISIQSDARTRSDRVLKVRHSEYPVSQCSDLDGGDDGDVQLPRALGCALAPAHCKQHCKAIPSIINVAALHGALAPIYRRPPDQPAAAAQQNRCSMITGRSIVHMASIIKNITIVHDASILNGRSIVHMVSIINMTDVTKPDNLQNATRLARYGLGQREQDGNGWIGRAFRPVRCSAAGGSEHADYKDSRGRRATAITTALAIPVSTQSTADLKPDMNRHTSRVSPIYIRDINGL